MEGLSANCNSKLCIFRALRSSDPVFSRYCAYIGDPLEPLNPPDFLKTATADTLCNFMEWSLNNSAIIKLDVAMNAFTRLQSLYKFEARHEMDSVTSQTVRDVR